MGKFTRYLKPVLVYALTLTMVLPTNIYAEANKENQFEVLESAKFKITHELYLEGEQLDKANYVEIEGYAFIAEESDYYKLIKDKDVDKYDFIEEDNRKFKDILLTKNKQTKKAYTYEMTLSKIRYDLKPEEARLPDKAAFADYLVTINDPLIQEEVKQVINGATDPIETAKRLYYYVYNNMIYNADSPIRNTGAYNAIRDILRSRVINEETKRVKDSDMVLNKQVGGVCYEYADLYAEMLKEAGIPARVVMGYVLKQEILDRLDTGKELNLLKTDPDAIHTWVEFYLEPYGWIIADPTIVPPEGDNVSHEPDFNYFAQTKDYYIKKAYNISAETIRAFTHVSADIKEQVKVRPDMNIIVQKLEPIQNGEEETETPAIPENEEKEQPMKESVEEKESNTPQENNPNEEEKDAEINEQEEVENSTDSNTDTPNGDLPIEEEEEVQPDPVPKYAEKIKNDYLSRQKKFKGMNNPSIKKFDYAGILQELDHKIMENKPLTRAEVAAIIYAVTDTDKSSATSTAFTDIDGHWAYKYIVALEKEQIMFGYSDNTFQPDKEINIDELNMVIKNRFGKQVKKLNSNLNKDFIRYLLNIHTYTNSAKG